MTVYRDFSRLDIEEAGEHVQDSCFSGSGGTDQGYFAAGKRLPQGYDTLLENDGANLSQGQRQLLNIARAAIADPPILLLDEATSNIDTRSEILIQKGLDQLMQGRTK